MFEQDDASKSDVKALQRKLQIRLLDLLFKNRFSDCLIRLKKSEKSPGLTGTGVGTEAS